MVLAISLVSYSLSLSLSLCVCVCVRVSWEVRSLEKVKTSPWKLSSSQALIWNERKKSRREKKVYTTIHSSQYLSKVPPWLVLQEQFLIFGHPSVLEHIAEYKHYRRCFTVNSIKIFKTYVLKNTFGWEPLNTKSLTIGVTRLFFNKVSEQGSRL